MKSQLRAAFKSGDHATALRILQQVTAETDSAFLQYAADTLDKLPASFIATQPIMRKKLALLGGATTQFLLPQLRLFALARGVWLDVLEGEYGLFEQMVWSESPELKEFAPDVILFHVCSHNLRFPNSADETEAAVHSQVERFAKLYAAARDRFGCSVIADNFCTPAERNFGNLEATTPHSPGQFIRSVNQRLSSSLPKQVFLHDAEHASAVFGKRAWNDPAYWDQAKLAVSFAALPAYAASVTSIVVALFGGSKKCLVLDLDNTLWGGVIGDDGLAGIHLSEGNPQGEAFLRFQHYCKALKERGVILAVASKNEMDNALEPFRRHPEMVLKESDISCFRVNWDPKDGNIRDIARELNIGLDSLVFFDDNPAEREIIRSRVPEVTVLEVPVDPALYVRCLDEAQLFGSAGVTAEDAIRTEYYQQAQQRALLSTSVGSYDDYLKALEMTADIAPINADNITRVTQLINKTNQFNLTTRRMTEADVRAIIQSPSHYTSTIRLTDKFGQAGLISVVTASIHDDTLRIDDWLMSCRVLKRGVEALEMERIVAFCQSRGLKHIVGRYVPTAKNKLVEQHFATLGFRAVTSTTNPDPGTAWQLTLGLDTPQTNHHIGIE